MVLVVVAHSHTATVLVHIDNSMSTCCRTQPQCHSRRTSCVARASHLSTTQQCEHLHLLSHAATVLVRQQSEQFIASLWWKAVRCASQLCESHCVHLTAVANQPEPNQCCKPTQTKCCKPTRTKCGASEWSNKPTFHAEWQTGLLPSSLSEWSECHQQCRKCQCNCERVCGCKCSQLQV